MTQLDLLNLIASNPYFMTILNIIESLQLKDCWLAAGSIRNAIWNHLEQSPLFDRETDLDVVFFDPDLSYEDTLCLEQNLIKRYPHYHWELKNQVYMHHHNPNTKPYTSARDAISKYPEKATALAVRLTDGQLELFAPYGLDDVTHFILSPTPHFSQDSERLALFHKRLQKKDWQKKWPKLTIINSD
ncbi:nucleotidyltransferase family protein [Streptococcus sp.]|nr:nucleotidyltransferase family protein [Streptococcus sp.]MDY3823681.1 nucleotidyltransferase family protein [Streptococcus sp.]